MRRCSAESARPGRGQIISIPFGDQTGEIEPTTFLRCARQNSLYPRKKMPTFTLRLYLSHR